MIYFIQNLLISSSISFHSGFHRKNERGQTLQVEVIQLSQTTFSVIDSTKVDSEYFICNFFFLEGRLVHLQFFIIKRYRDFRDSLFTWRRIQARAKRICICTSGEA